MNVLIINTAKDQQNGLLTRVDSAITMELYKKKGDNEHKIKLISKVQ